MERSNARSIAPFAGVVAFGLARAIEYRRSSNNTNMHQMYFRSAIACVQSNDFSMAHNYKARPPITAQMFDHSDFRRFVQSGSNCASL